MNDQKDTQKTIVNSKGTAEFNGAPALSHKPIYEYANKKTEKLVTALYMITDCMEENDALKGKLRLLGVNLLSDIYKLPIIAPVEKNTNITLALSHIGEIMAFVGIAHTIGLVSEMNATILKKEFSLLENELLSYQKENQSSSFGGVLFESQKNSSFELSSDMFEVGEKFNTIAEISTKPADSVKDIYANKKTSYNMSFTTPARTNLASASIKKSYVHSSSPLDKKERTDKILALIKDKKDVSIKDIVYAFTDCSEKTIQRELNTLVDKGQIKKIGAKRWSRYQAI